MLLQWHCCSTNAAATEAAPELRNYGTTEATPDYKTTSQRDNEWGGSHLYSCGLVVCEAIAKPAQSSWLVAHSLLYSLYFLYLLYPFDLLSRSLVDCEALAKPAQLMAFLYLSIPLYTFYTPFDFCL